jgi:hypothetical protein
VFGAFMELVPGYHRLIRDTALKGRCYQHGSVAFMGMKEAPDVVAALAKIKLIGRAVAKDLTHTRLRSLAVVQGTPQQLDRPAGGFSGSAWDAYDSAGEQMCFSPGPP